MVAARSAGPATAATAATGTAATTTATLGGQIWLGHPLHCFLFYFSAPSPTVGWKPSSLLWIAPQGQGGPSPSPPDKEWRQRSCEKDSPFNPWDSSQVAGGEFRIHQFWLFLEFKIHLFWLWRVSPTFLPRFATIVCVYNVPDELLANSSPPSISRRVWSGFRSTASSWPVCCGGRERESDKTGKRGRGGAGVTFSDWYTPKTDTDGG